MTDEQLTAIIGAGENPGVEFKNARSRTDPSFVEVVRAALGMANRRDGGIIIVGVDDNGNAPGVSAQQAATWTQPDHVRQALAPFADPFVYVDVEIRTVANGPHAGHQFVIVSVQEFDQIPVLCGKGATRGGVEYVREGACYVRPSHMPATTQVVNQQQMRDLLDLAIEKGVRKFLARARAVGLPVNAPAPPADEDLFAAQRRDFDE